MRRRAWTWRLWLVASGLWVALAVAWFPETRDMERLTVGFAPPTPTVFSQNDCDGFLDPTASAACHSSMKAIRHSQEMRRERLFLESVGLVALLAGPPLLMLMGLVLFGPGDRSRPRLSGH